MKPSIILVFLLNVTPSHCHHMTIPRGKCGFLIHLGSVTSHHGKKYLVPTHAYNHFRCSPNIPKVIGLCAPLSSTFPRRGSLDAILNKRTVLCPPLVSTYCLSWFFQCPPMLISLLGQLLPLGLERKTTLHLPHSSLSTLLSSLCGF
jgi:hypothetical protein